MKTYDLSSQTVIESSLPEVLFGQKVNDALLAQAVRVYRARLRQGNANTKTRGEVAGSTRKIYKQKGTGRARHGSIKAPVFVGGGTVHGSRSHAFDLEMPITMRRKALISALSLRADNVVGLKGLSEFEGKTSHINKGLKAVVENDKKVLCIIASADLIGFRNSVNNIERVITVPAQDVTALDVMMYPNVVIDEEAIPVLVERLSAKKKEDKN